MQETRRSFGTKDRVFDALLLVKVRVEGKDILLTDGGRGGGVGLELLVGWVAEGLWP